MPTTIIESGRNSYGTKTVWMFCLTIDYVDGTQEIIQSGGTCRASQEGALRENNLKTIERYDAGREFRGWNRPGYVDTA